MNPFCTTGSFSFTQNFENPLLSPVVVWDVITGNARIYSLLLYIKTHGKKTEKVHGDISDILTMVRVY